MITLKRSSAIFSCKEWLKDNKDKLVPTNTKNKQLVSALEKLNIEVDSSEMIAEMTEEEYSCLYEEVDNLSNVELSQLLNKISLEKHSSYTCDRHKVYNDDSKADFDY